MNKYIIYCTEEQTKKAIELGAPLIENRNESNTSPLCYYNLTYYFIPTTEQMISWLEDQDTVDSISIEKSTIINEKNKWQYSIWDTEELWDCGGHGYSSRKDATLAAIDAALYYLSNKK